MKDIKKEIVNSLREILKEEISGDVEIEISRPQDFSHGDYSTNVALTIFHKFKEKFKNPVDLASFITNKLQKKLPETDKIEVLKPGFINFFLSEKYLLQKIDQIASSKNYGKGDSLKSKKIMLEFADPNPFKEFHIGHLRNITLGECFARLLEYQGADLWRVNYQGDVGLHVARALYGLLQISNLKSQISNLQKKPIGERSKFLGDAYARGAKDYEESDKAKKEIQEINLKIYRHQDPNLNKLWEEGRGWSLDHFEDIYKRLGTKYKRYYFESEVAEPGKEIVLSHLRGGTFERHEGAVVFRGDHTRVFITKEDYATYEAKDLALAKIKFEDFKYDKSIIITANEQIEYFKVVLEAMKKVFPELAKKTIHESFGFVNLKEGKMSSRSGSVVTGEWLMSEAKKRLKTQFEKMDEETLEKVAVGAVKYSMLKFSRTSDILFSFDESISLEGNSGPYLQYTYARTQSVLAKVKRQKSKVKIKIPTSAKASAGRQNPKLEKEELLVLRLLIHFSEITREAGENFAPNTLCNYLFDLSQKFNNFYQKVPILNPEVSIGNHPRGGREGVRNFRLGLTFAVGQIIKTGLYLLGIKSPNKM
ncbi:MAG: arginine--tRNA ligase [Candidatus Levybacteria bacterium RIFCSPLOWO2_01_FULL_38_21]|nr:MAG: arginine--tRNA ligase [Candidatus Levybacteria bacterium RIFCSPLOWO2_01_FULL_38_21]